MSGLYPGGPRSRRPFLVTSYVADSAGVPTAVLPSRCPRGADSGDPTCAISVDHHRHRETGPPHPLAVARCRTHRVGFTLYPPGFAPYRRQPVAKIAPDGSAVATEEVGLRQDYADTVFAAAVDGADGRRWARDSDVAVPDRWWSTQGRHLRLAEHLVGMARSLNAGAREAIAAVLSVSGLKQREGHSTVGYRAISAAVCEMLQELRGGIASRAFALLVCGHLAGAWGEPMRWDVRREDLERSPFCCRGTPAQI